jgi:hypothetical protein
MWHSASIYGYSRIMLCCSCSQECINWQPVLHQSLRRGCCVVLRLGWVALSCIKEQLRCCRNDALGDVLCLAWRCCQPAVRSGGLI